MRRAEALTALMGVSLAALAMATEAMAQAPAKEQSATVEEFVVTARRSSERLQDIPLAITAQTSVQLEAKGIADLKDLARFTPSLQFKDFVTSFHGNATIRGLSQINTSNAIGNVGVFMNGVYLQRTYMANQGLGDYERIEVVKGPQSALYGQNTFSGAINYVTKAPSKDFEANGKVTIGEGGRREYNLGVGGPIVKDILMFRVFAGLSDYDGTWKNNLPGDAGRLKEFGGYHRTAYSGALKFTPTEKLNIDLFYSETKKADELRPFYTLEGTFVEDKVNCGPNSALGRPSLYCGVFPVNPSALRSGVGARPADPFSVNQPPTRASSKIFRGGIDYDFTSELAAHYSYGLTSGSAQENLSFASNSFNPTGRTTVNTQHEGGKLVYSSHELRLAYNPAKLPFKLEGGYFHSYAKDRFYFGTRATPLGTPILEPSDPLLAPGPGFVVFSNFDARYTIDSVFGRGSLNLLDDKATLSAEVRYSDTKILYNDIAGRAAVPTRPLLESSYKDWTPRFTAEYKVTPRNLAYVSAARGVKTGGFNGYVTSNITLNPNEQAFGEETNWTYEAGIKNTFLDGRLILNADVFYVDWKNKQASVPPANYVAPASPVAGSVAPNIYATIGDASAIGLEVDGAFKPIRALSLTYAVSLTNPKYGANAIAANFVGLCDDVICSKDGRIKDKIIERSSKLSATLGAEYTGELNDRWSYFVGGDTTYQSKQYTDPENLGSIKAFGLTNLRAGLDNGRIRAWIWADNVFDKSYVQSVFYIQSTRQFTASYGEKRTIGVTVTARY